MVLSHVSSRQLEGRKLEGYTKSEVLYSNLSAEKMAEMEEAGEVDAWVMALPNGVCKPFVDAIERAKGGKSVIIDLGADYRFEEGWTYGLPGACLGSSLPRVSAVQLTYPLAFFTELYSRKKLRSAKRIANPGCFATSTQLLIAPLLPHLDLSNPPTVVASSGYSGAGTKSGPPAQDGFPTTVSKIVRP